MSGGLTNIGFMTSSANVPNLYEYYDLDRGDACSAMGILLADKDALLESQGCAATDPRRSELQLAFAVLSSPAKRGLYDRALAAGRAITRAELEYLANFGVWPDPALQRGAVPPQPPEQPQPRPQQPYKMPQPSPYAQPYNPFQQRGYQAPVPAEVLKETADNLRAYSAYLNGPAERATAGQRVVMAMIDFSVVAMLSSLAVGLFAWTDNTAALSLLLLSVLYVVGLESRFGATLGKKLLGYEVRNRKNGQKLSVVESAKRQWFKLVYFIPGPGTVASIVGAIWGWDSINKSNDFISVHDDIVDAEVVKMRKQP